MTGGHLHMYDEQPCGTTIRISNKAGSLFQSGFSPVPVVGLTRKRYHGAAGALLTVFFLTCAPNIQRTELDFMRMAGWNLFLTGTREGYRGATREGREY
jgi:hypothetical protein